MLSIEFYGSSDFSLAILKKLKEFHDRNLINLVNVVSQSSKPQGRKNEVKDNPVVAYCKEMGIKVVNQSVPEPVEGRVVSSVNSITALSNEIPQQVRDDTNVGVDLAIVAAYGRIIKQKELDSTKYGFINIHGSLLPAWRGACPVQMCIRYQDIKNTGITFIKMDKGMDTGDILLQSPLYQDIAVETHDCASHRCVSQGIQDLTSGELMDRLAMLSAEVLEKDFDTIFNPEKWKLRPQVIDNSPTYCSIKDMDKSNFEITNSDTIKSAHGKIMSANPEPKAWGIFKFGEKEIRVNIFRSKMIDDLVETHDCASHRCASLRIFEGRLYVELNDGFLEILEIQPEGKKVMTARDFLNGVRNG